MNKLRTLSVKYPGTNLSYKELCRKSICVHIFQLLQGLDGASHTAQSVGDVNEILGFRGMDLLERLNVGDAVSDRHRIQYTLYITSGIH